MILFSFSPPSPVRLSVIVFLHVENKRSTDVLEARIENILREIYAIVGYKIYHRDCRDRDSS
jgi:hypothetical protein